MGMDEGLTGMSTSGFRCMGICCRALMDLSGARRCASSKTGVGDCKSGAPTTAPPSPDPNEHARAESREVCGRRARARTAGCFAIVARGWDDGVGGSGVIGGRVA